MAIALAPAPPPAGQAGGEPLALADGIELIGEYEGSGFKEPPLLVRRGDGQMIKLPRLLYLIAAAADGRRDPAAVAAVVTERYGKRVGAKSVSHLVEKKLRPLGVLALADGTTPELPKRAPVMALRHRRPLIPERGVNLIARGFTWLHMPIAQAAVLLAIAALDVWLFGIHGVAGGMRAVLYNPTLLLGVLLSVIAATAFHEIGHASACRYGGARPGVVGVGVYLVWPAFYCDVTDAYRLDRPGRLRTDLGGVYFNGIFALLAGLAYFATGQEALLLVAFAQHTIVLQQLVPLLRFDGYYVLSDLTGVPDILSRIKPIFVSLVPGGGRQPLVAELKPWVRIVVTLYLLLLVPTLGFMIVSTVIAAPRMLATAYDSLGMQLDHMRAAADASAVALGAFQSGALVMPIAAIAVSLFRSGKMATRGVLGWSSGSASRRALALVAMAAVIGAAAFTWWPNGDYQPIRPGERGTIGDALSSLPNVATGRAAISTAHDQQLGQSSTVREPDASQPHGAGAHAPQRVSPDDPAAPAEPDGGWSDDSWDDGGDAGAEPSFDDAGAGATEPTSAAPTPAPTSTTAPSGSATPTPAQPSPTATASPTATSTPTPTATSTSTPTPTSTPTSSPVAQPTAPAPTATPSSTAALPTVTP